MQKYTNSIKVQMKEVIKNPMGCNEFSKNLIQTSFICLKITSSES